MISIFLSLKIIQHLDNMFVYQMANNIDDIGLFLDILMKLKKKYWLLWMND